MYRHRRVALRSCLTLSRLDEIKDLKAALAGKLISRAAQFNQGRCDECDSKEGEDRTQGPETFADDDTGPISNKQIVLFEYKNMKLTKFLDDRSVLKISMILYTSCR